jgi:hypothetical protein
MDELEEETLKMLKKIEPMVGKVEVNSKKGEEMLTNMKAYIADSKHFLKQKNLVKAFESVVWSWAIMEICEELGFFKLEK